MNDWRSKLPGCLKEQLWVDTRLEFPIGMAIYPTGCEALMEAIDMFRLAYGRDPGYVFRLKDEMKWYVAVDIAVVRHVERRINDCQDNSVGT